MTDALARAAACRLKPDRCMSCNGIIAGVADQDLAPGLDIKLGMVSDECGLVCNECTTKLIEARAKARGG